MVSLAPGVLIFHYGIEERLAQEQLSVGCLNSIEEKGKEKKNFFKI
jgi:hypothetical protein